MEFTGKKGEKRRFLRGGGVAKARLIFPLLEEYFLLFGGFGDTIGWNMYAWKYCKILPGKAFES
jgi:hypothetical protein